MENCSFQSQCMSIMEILAKAALAEINRRVDDSCAVLRLEISQSQNDIYVLKKKCEVMEAELKRTRIRAKKKGFQTSISERCSPLVKNFINKEVDSVAWDRESSVELMQHPQRADMEPAGEVDVIPIKEETAEESTWNNDHVEQNTQAEHQPFIPDVLIEHYHSESSALLPSLTDDPDAFPSIPDQQVTDYQTHADLVVKREREEEAEKAAGAIGIGSGSCFVVDDAERQPWPPTDCDRDIGTGDPGFPYGTMPQYEQSPSLFTCQSGPATSHSMNEDIGSPMHSVGKLHLARLTAARVKRRARNFGYKRLQQMHAPEEGRSTLTPVNSIHQSGLSLQPAQQHQYRTTTAAAAVGTRDLSQGSTAPHHLATSAYSGYSRGNIGLARTRMRTPLWRTGIGEKRFSCTYCGKSFMRFSQLKEHLRSHTGEKPFSCLQCGRSFTKQCNLIRHAVVHSGEKPYECATCGKCFTQRSSLKSHQKTVH